MLLSHTQFIENRVYDDEDDEEEASKSKGADSDINTKNENNKKDPEAFFVENVSLALRNSFNFVEDAFHQVEVRTISFSIQCLFKCFRIHYSQNYT